MTATVLFFLSRSAALRDLHSFPTRRSSDLQVAVSASGSPAHDVGDVGGIAHVHHHLEQRIAGQRRSEEHTSELQSRGHLVCRLLLEKKNKIEHWCCQR